MVTKDVEEIIAELKKGRVAGIPTETVYGLAGDIENPNAIKAIFETKERPFFDPLIVHVSNKQKAKEITYWNPLAECLAEKFWPGPLTIVAPKRAEISDLITSGLKSVAVRCPSHPLALELLKSFKGLAAPSANKFKKTSPTSADHVASEFDDSLMILDGGECNVGIESTVVGIISETEVEIYRPGMITKEQIQAALDQFDRKVLVSYTESPVAPGQMEDHYMPEIPLVFNQSLKNKNEIITLMKTSLKNDSLNPVTIVLNENPQLTARKLYSMFREASKTGHDFIIVQPPKDHHSEDWKGIINRLEKAATLKL